MRAYWKDIVSAVLALTAGIIVFAQLQGATWWFFGSWTSALAVLAILGIGMMWTNLSELLAFADAVSFIEAGLWLLAGTVVLGCLFADTTKIEFVWSAVAIGAAWAVQMSRHLWRITHHSKEAHAYAHVR